MAAENCFFIRPGENGDRTRLIYSVCSGPASFPSRNPPLQHPGHFFLAAVISKHEITKGKKGTEGLSIDPSLPFSSENERAAGIDSDPI
jgi:hypothetical protein